MNTHYLEIIRNDLNSYIESLGDSTEKNISMEDIPVMGTLEARLAFAAYLRGQTEAALYWEEVTGQKGIWTNQLLTTTYLLIPDLEDKLSRIVQRIVPEDYVEYKGNGNLSGHPGGESIDVTREMVLLKLLLPEIIPFLSPPSTRKSYLYSSLSVKRIMPNINHAIDILTREFYKEKYGETRGKTEDITCFTYHRRH